MNNVDTVSTDVLIIGGGPSGLASAIHLADTLKLKGLNHRILLVELQLIYQINLRSAQTFNMLDGQATIN